jgi:hypothetical protein
MALKCKANFHFGSENLQPQILISNRVAQVNSIPAFAAYSRNYARTTVKRTLQPIVGDGQRPVTLRLYVRLSSLTQSKRSG